MSEAEAGVRVFRRVSPWRLAGGGLAQVPLPWGVMLVYLAWTGWQVRANGLLLALMVALALLGVVVAWGDARVRQRGRLTLSHDTLRYEDGSRWAWLRRRASWTLDLNAVRAGHIVLGWSGLPPLPRAHHHVRLLWGRSPRMGQVLPGEWVPVDGDAIAAPVGDMSAGSAGAQAIDDSPQARVAALPLVVALRADGVPIPALGWRHPQQPGFDLMASARLRRVLAALAVLVAATASLHVGLIHEYYFVRPPLALWLAVGALAALAAAAWLWREPVAAVQARVSQGELRLTQALVALLLGGVAGLCAPTLPLLAGRVLTPVQTLRFEWQMGGQGAGGLMLRSVDQPEVPAIAPHWRVATALMATAQAHSIPVALEVRRGPAGLWWQYDAAPLLAEAAQAGPPR